jgi:hypothetical protein
MRLGTSTLLLALGVLSASVARAGNHDEAVNGDLSNDRLVPTIIPVSTGSNRIKATSAAGDREYFRLTVPTGFRLIAVNVVSSTSPSVSFIAVQQGTVFTEPPTGTNVANLLGYHHFGAGQGNVLDDMGTGFGAIGFVPPLPAASYVFWAQETGGAVTYELDFVVAAVPTVPLGRPYVLLLAGVTVGLGAWRLRTRRAPPIASVA